MDRILQFGKYKGRTIPSVIDDDPQYIQWAYNNLERFQLTEEEKYLLYNSLSREGVIDKELLADINVFPKIEVEGSMDENSLKNIFTPITSSTLFEQRKPIQDEYNSLLSYCDRIARSFNGGDIENYNYYLRDIIEEISAIKRKTKYVISRPNFTDAQKESASKLIETIEKLLPVVNDFFVPYNKKVDEVYKRIEDRYKIKELQIAARKQEKLREDRNIAVDKHPYKDIDATFLAKLDDILGEGKYKIHQCVFRIDLNTNSLSAITLRQLRDVFGESKIEVSDKNGETLTVFLTQNIEPVSSNQAEKNYIEAVDSFLRGLKMEQREQLFSLGKEESKKIFDKAINYFSKHGEYPAFSQLFDDNTWENLNVDDIKKWLDNMSYSDMEEIYNYLTTDWKGKQNYPGSENSDNTENKDGNNASGVSGPF